MVLEVHFSPLQLWEQGPCYSKKSELQCIYYTYLKMWCIDFLKKGSLFIIMNIMRHLLTLSIEIILILCFNFLITIFNLKEWYLFQQISFHFICNTALYVVATCISMQLVYPLVEEPE